jgi:ABC-2 type transport system permease protein
LNGQLLEPTYDETPDKVLPYLTAGSSHLQEGLSWIAEALASGKDTLKVMTPGVTDISYITDSAFTVEPLLTTVPGKVWLKRGDLVIDSTLPPFNPENGDVKATSFSPVIQLTKQVNDKEQRIVVAGDADFASNMRLPVLSNAGFLMPVYSWLCYNRFPVSMTRIPSKDTLLRIGEANAYAQKIVYMWVLPAIILLAGIILLVRRKNK